MLGWEVGGAVLEVTIAKLRPNSSRPATPAPASSSWERRESASPAWQTSFLAATRNSTTAAETASTWGPRLLRAMPERPLRPVLKWVIGSTRLKRRFVLVEEYHYEGGLQVGSPLLVLSLSACRSEREKQL